MPNTSTISSALFMALALGCVAHPALAQKGCAAEAPLQINIAPDSFERTLKDGEHVLARSTTHRGAIEFRAHVQNKSVGRTEFVIGGKRVKEVTEAQLPPEAKRCLTKDGGASLQPAQKIALGDRFIELLIPPAHAALGIGTPSCASAPGNHVFKVVACYDYGGGPVCALDHIVNGRHCRYVVV